MSANGVSRRDFLAAAGAGVAGAASVLESAVAAAKPAVPAASRTAPKPDAAVPAPGSDPTGWTIREASQALRRGAVSSVDLTRACLERIDRLNPSLNACITVTADAALQAARRCDAERRAGKPHGALHGIPVALKDNIDTAGIRTTAASALYEDRIPAEDAHVVRRLREAGAVLLGKLNLHEFAFGGTSTVSRFGPVRNPWALDRIAGGSSGGSAVAVAAGLCFAALGTDTAGSVRIPASFCGVVGLKPTYGRVSNRGVIPLSWTHDHVGPLTRSVEDAALVLQAIAGFDVADPASREVPAEPSLREIERTAAKPRLGIPRKPFFDDLDPEVAQAVAAAIETLGRQAAGVVDVELPPGGFRSSGLYVRVRGPEAYAFHARTLKESPEKYQDPTRAALMKFADVKADDYVNARREVELLRRTILETFSRVDLLVTPTMPVPPILIAEADRENPVDWRNTVPFSTYGLPAVSIPCGRTRAGLPIGLQIAGPPLGEAAVLRFALAFERTAGRNTMPRPAA
ncbi:MAG TPA: amidase [Candidatus Polarisedimenticolia bacterium]|nr:amidase [Candidatus Polarisedimenticolia bacterium]